MGLIEEGKRIYSFDLLKILLSFSVVFHHLHGALDNDYWFFWSNNITPIFMCLSFWLVEPAISCCDTKKILIRIKKLFTPMWFWALIYGGGYWIIQKTTGTKLINGISDVLWQMIMGNSETLNKSMWFHFCLLWITIILFLAVYHAPQIHKDLWVAILFLLALFMQYSSINYTLCSQMNYPMMNPMGRLMEMLPCAITGYILRRYNIYESFKKDRMSIMIFAIGILAFIFLYFRESKIPGFWTQGISHVFVSAIVVMVMYYFQDLLILIDKSTVIKKIILTVSQYTLGIYCMHRFVGVFLNVVFYGKEPNEKISFIGCVFVFAICWFVSYMIDHIPISIIKQSIK